MTKCQSQFDFIKHYYEINKLNKSICRYLKFNYYLIQLFQLYITFIHLFIYYININKETI